MNTVMFVHNLFLTVRCSRLWLAVIALFLCLSITACAILGVNVLAAGEKDFIKWVDFSPTYAVLYRAMQYDIESYDTDQHIDWIMLLAAAACKNGGNFTSKTSEIDAIAKRIQDGESPADITGSMQYYDYYYEAYSAVLSEFLGETKDGYGLQVYSPIAYGYGYSHSDDFGNSRSYGFKRKHLGNDLIGSVGTPIIAVEDGIVEHLGWNKYGGWRIGIRSYDTKRYYYYAHLRKGHPYVEYLREGMEVKAGDVIGYLGMTGYSDTEDYNGMTVPHLHFGMQLIFDESQIDSNYEIWIDVYNIVKLLQNQRSHVQKNADTGDYERADA